MRIQYRNTIGTRTITVAAQPHASVTDSPRFGGGHSTVPSSYKSDSWHLGASQRGVERWTTPVATASSWDRQVFPFRWDAAAFPTRCRGKSGAPWHRGAMDRVGLMTNDPPAASNRPAQCEARFIPADGERNCRTRSRALVPTVLARDRPPSLCFLLGRLLADGTRMDRARSRQPGRRSAAADLHHPIIRKCSFDRRHVQQGENESSKHGSQPYRFVGNAEQPGIGIVIDRQRAHRPWLRRHREL
jgi:hypothetical protein